MKSVAFGATRHLLALLAAGGLAGCGDTAKYPVEQGIGPDPVLPEPVKRLIPTVKVAPVKGWADGAAPVPAEDLQVNAFARDLDHPRWLYVLPNGDVLVAETNAPARPDKEPSLKDRIAGAVMKKAGARTPSAERITLLRDADGDGVAETRTQFLTGLYSPFGMALAGDRFYVANADALVRFPYKDGDTHISAQPEFVANLPGGINHHWTKSLVASADGKQLYVGVGSNSNIGENGMDAELNRAAILQVDTDDGGIRVYASGLRNPVGMAWEPSTQRLWTVVNERDEIGSDLVPDYLTSVREGGFYGWPYSYYGQHVDERVQPQDPEKVAQAIKPDYALGAHTASLGLSFSGSALLPARFRNGAFIGQHGSWNRNPPSGYKVIFVPFVDGKPQGMPITVLDGFLDDEGGAQGRPVGVTLDKRGALLVADDVGNVIWRVTPKRAGTP
ncbi:PQQ-dependent sugar dehydrogenase [Pseudomonas sp. Hp2]|uniref:PQQ-dependent sugar dehydrogenase n=1 Tax=Pseudomonas sp. Hp2 TaxID=701189 RepID=UPI001128B50D|nr:sorbosone dehydrogenase family protein [Pseudomonas sp. Hp2]